MEREGASPDDAESQTKTPYSDESELVPRKVGNVEAASSQRSDPLGPYFQEVFRVHHRSPPEWSGGFA
jgi:hypothetical protein